METPADLIDTRLVRKLASILKDTGLTEIEIEQGGLRIRVAREMTLSAPQTYTIPTPAAPALAAPSTPKTETPSDRTGELVKSPMVGTIYLQAQPGTPAFIKVGDRVTQGQTLMIVEAMKTMNPIPAPRAGRVVEILVEDSQPVEYGAPLVVLE